jgi:hypothetical protein
MTKITKLFWFSLFIFLFLGCEDVNYQNSIENPELQDAMIKKSKLHEELPKYNYSKNDKKIEEFTKIVNYALKNKGFRKSLKNQALERRDGDFNVFLNFENKKSRNVEAGLIRALENMKGKEMNKTPLEFLISFKKEFPLIQLSIPVHCKQWKVSKQYPLVTYVPLDYKDPEAYKIKAFDHKGNIHWIRTDKAPKVPVVVVRQSERRKPNGELREGFVNNELKDLEPPPGGGGGTSGDDYITFGNKQNGDIIRLEWVKVLDVSLYESWLSGKLELRIEWNYENSGYDDRHLYLFEDKFARNCLEDYGCSSDGYLFTWDLYDIGSEVSFLWYEMDYPLINGNDYTIDYTFSNGFRVFFTINNGQQLIWDEADLLDFYHDYDHVYSPNNILFYKLEGER